MTMTFECDWLNKRKLPTGLAHEERQTRCELALSVNGHAVFRNEDRLNAHKVNRTAHVSSYPLAYWLAANWWRLCWESPRKPSHLNDQDWLMSHNVGAAAGGFYWPNLTIASDGESVHLQQVATRETSAPLRYLDNLSEWISIKEFEHGVSAFVEQSLDRLSSKNVLNTDLHQLWEEVTAERNDPLRFKQRRLEARLGCDPDEAPEALISQLLGMMAENGESAVEEVAQAVGQQAPQTLSALEGELKDSFKLELPMTKNLKDLSMSTGTPWQRGYRLASKLREFWSLPNGKLSNEKFSECVSLSCEAITRSESSTYPVALGKRNGQEKISFHLGKTRVEQRRFMLARLIGDAIINDPSERLLPCTDVGTARQKFQRAFAQEFLCPYSDVLEYLGTESPDEDQKESAAEHFEVSPFMISHIFENHGALRLLP